MESCSQDVVHLAGFFSSQGYKVIETQSAYWCELHPFCFQNFPFHLAIAPPPEELDDLFMQKFAVLLRYNSIDDRHTIPGFNWICDDRGYGLHSLEHRFRNRVKRGLKLTEVKPVDFHFLAREGLALILDVARRQGRNPDFANQKAWEKYCLAAAAFPNFDAHGVFVKGRLIAFLVGVKINNVYFCLLQASRTDYLSYCPNNALLYVIITTKFQDPAMEIVSHGLASVEHVGTLDKFKTGMGFRREKVNFKLVFNPFFEWLKNDNILSSIDRLSSYFPKNNFFRKANALLKQMNPEKAQVMQTV